MKTKLQRRQALRMTWNEQKTTYKQKREGFIAFLAYANVLLQSQGLNEEKADKMIGKVEKLSLVELERKTYEIQDLVGGF